MWKRIRHRIELAGVKVLAALPGVLPHRFSVKAVGLLGALAFDLFRIRRAVTLENIERAFGGTIDKSERVRIGRRSYVNFAKSMAEFAIMGRLSRTALNRLVRFEGAEHFDAALSHGKGIIAVTGHFGSWELFGAAAAACGYPIDFLVGDQTNKLVDNLMNGIRNDAGIGIIARGIAARGVFQSLGNNRIVALLFDQDARKAGIFVDFFGTPASTFPGAAQFALRTGAPIIFSYIVRQPDESHVAYIQPPVYPDPGSEKEEEIARLTAAFTNELQGCATRHPDHYFWAHRRWKTKPAPPAERT